MSHEVILGQTQHHSLDWLSSTTNNDSTPRLSRVKTRVNRKANGTKIEKVITTVQETLYRRSAILTQAYDIR